MSTTTLSSTRKNKHVILDQERLKRAQKVLGTRTETETIEIALERVITEAEKDKIAWAAHDKFFKSGRKKGIFVNDVFGRLED
ncbi:MAG: hypothetical protein ACRD6X_04265 [Pyrinomonadaceae bacterium]